MVEIPKIVLERAEREVGGGTRINKVFCLFQMVKAHVHMFT